MIQIIDTHQHFWKYDPVDFDWITEEMSIIQKDFLPNDLSILLQAENVDACIAVQARQTIEETNWLIQLAETNKFIKGVVGWVDLQDELIEEKLEFYQQFVKLKGFRHVLQGEAPSFMLQKAFLNGIRQLNRFGFTYDILIFPHQLKAAIQLVQSFPDQHFVIDHIAKPNIKLAEIDDWRTDIKKISQYQNVDCKLSGMVTEADWKNWTKGSLIPYLDVVVNNFGTSRVMFGSDWPVCLVATSYKNWLNLIKDYFSDFTTEEQENIFSRNAIRFYNL